MQLTNDGGLSEDPSQAAAANKEKPSVPAQPSLQGSATLAADAEPWMKGAALAQPSLQQLGTLAADAELRFNDAI